MLQEWQLVLFLSQNLHPIAFFSKKMSCSMQRQSAYVRELYVVSEAVAKFRHYLMGHKFVIKNGLENFEDFYISEFTNSQAAEMAS